MSSLHAVKKKLIMHPVLRSKSHDPLSSPIRLVSLVYDPIKGGSATAGIGPV
jgi:hypothetical protein